MLPVRIGEATEAFVFDTGASVSVFDRSLIVGSAVDRSELQTAGGPLTVERFATPQALLGDAPLTSSPLACAVDLEVFRRAAGLPIRGVAGMDWAAQRMVRIDFDRGEFLVLDELPDDLGEAFPLAFKAGAPYVTADVPERGAVEFLVDTGSVGAATIDAAAFDALLGAEKLTNVVRTETVTPRGASQATVARLESLRLGRFETPNLWLQRREAGPPSLGLDYWARFTMTFDFPHGKLYLKPGRFFDKHDRRTLAGWRIRNRDGATVVLSVEPGGPAERAGLVAGDVLTKFGERTLAGLPPGALDRRLSVPGATIEVRVRRGSKEFPTQLRLPP